MIASEMGTGQSIRSEEPLFEGFGGKGGMLALVGNSCDEFYDVAQER